MATVRGLNGAAMQAAVYEEFGIQPGSMYGIEQNGLRFDGTSADEGLVYVTLVGRATRAQAERILAAQFAEVPRD